MSQPFFVRLLSRAERKAIQKLRKRPPNVEVYRRTQAVYFSSKGLKAQQIAEIVGRSRISVTRWLHEFEKHGLLALWPGKSTGRPPKADEDFQGALVAAIEQNPQDLGYPFTRWSVDLLTEHLRRKLHVDVSCSTVYNTLKRLGYRYGRPKLDLKHRQDPKDVQRAKRQKKAALKKRKPAPVVVLSRIVTKRNSTSIQDYLVAGQHAVGE
jgi:transposase